MKHIDLTEYFIEPSFLWLWLRVIHYQQHICHVVVMDIFIIYIQYKQGCAFPPQYSEYRASSRNHYRIRSPAFWDDGGLVQLLLHCCYILGYWRICSYCLIHIFSSNAAALQNV